MTLGLIWDQTTLANGTSCNMTNNRTKVLLIEVWLTGIVSFSKLQWFCKNWFLKKNLEETNEELFINFIFIVSFFFRIPPTSPPFFLCPFCFLSLPPHFFLLAFCLPTPFLFFYYSFSIFTFSNSTFSQNISIIYLTVIQNKVHLDCGLLCWSYC